MRFLRFVAAFLRFFLDFPALFKAIAIACLRGFPALISVEILREIVLLPEPDLRGIGSTLTD